MWAYLILTLGSLVFWALYQMAPSGLQLFAVNNVDLHVWGITVAPQWIQNINTVVIVIGGPLLAAAFSRLRGRGWRDRKSVVSGKSVSVRVDLGGRRIINTKKTSKQHNHKLHENIPN